MGGKGPAIVRYRMLMTEQQSYNFALGNGNLYLAWLKLRGIAAMIPEEYGIPIPDMPPEVHEQVIDNNEKVTLKKALDTKQVEVYRGVNLFIEESYAKGELDAMI